MQYINEANDMLGEEEDNPNELKIFFSNLESDTQDKMLDLLKKELNVTDDDDVSIDKMMEILSQSPIFVINSEDLVHKLNFDI